MSPLTDTPINPVTLAFSDRALEKEFRADGQSQSLGPLRVSLAAGLAVNGLLGLMDLVERAWQPEVYGVVSVIRFALVCPILGVLFLVSFAPFFRRFQNLILWLGAVGAGAGLSLIVVAVASGTTPYAWSVHSAPIGIDAGCLYLYVVFCCLCFRLRFLAAAVFCGTIGALCGLLAWMTTGAAVLLGVYVLLLASMALGLAAAYILDRSRRADFLRRRKVQKQAEELDHARQELDALVSVDTLTGLASRRHFFEMAERDLERCRRYGHPLAIIMLDLDHFKVVNNTCGHVTGDRVLQAVAGQIHYNVREADTAGRYGGEEFVVVLPETDHEAAQQVGERLRSFIESLRIDAAIGRLSITVSVGIAASADMGTATLDDLIYRADKALLASKRAGRNRVTIWDAVTDESMIDRSEGE